ncbi:MAG: hypothetical protein NTV80_10075 [Verrucomicrobia bacterium]|nr:hypothetical protein [Verrucomicrobiota bacterium]
MIRILTVLCLLGTFSEGAEVENAQAKQMAILEDKRINESSGLTQSPRDPKVFWTHNDSGADPCLYAISQSGQTLAKVRLPRAVNFDWEDMASARDEAGQPHLYIADCGDNLLARASLQVYQIPEPKLPEHPDKEILSAEPKIYHASYPDGHHNAETLLVHPQTRRLYIVTKSETKQSAVYAFPEKLITDGPMVLEKLCDLEFPARAHLGKRPLDACQTTSGTFSPDGSRVAISTYSFIHEWRIAPGETLKFALARPAHLIELPYLRQCEALCYDQDNQALYLTSEHLPTPLIRIGR